MRIGILAGIVLCVLTCSAYADVPTLQINRWMGKTVTIETKQGKAKGKLIGFDTYSITLLTPEGGFKVIERSKITSFQGKGSPPPVPRDKSKTPQPQPPPRRSTSARPVIYLEPSGSSENRRPPPKPPATSTPQKTLKKTSPPEPTAPSTSETAPTNTGTTYQPKTRARAAFAAEIGLISNPIESGVAYEVSGVLYFPAGYFKVGYASSDTFHANFGLGGSFGGIHSFELYVDAINVYIFPGSTLLTYWRPSVEMGYRFSPSGGLFFRFTVHAGVVLSASYDGFFSFEMGSRLAFGYSF
ncbi:MAG: hypothetical protein EP343_17960 [Deltaproteobacteria bacterium]|nr:MAG: hypothetical protein EP343_17960 [Deltaproteobacteria bacterium]